MDENDLISKTQRKRRMTELQEVGKELVKLSAEQLGRLALPESLLEAVLACKRFNKHEAIRRQMQYIGRIMRDLDPAPIVDQLSSLQGPSRKQTALLHLAEKWRDELMVDAGAMGRFEREFPHADHGKVRALIEAAREERAAKRAPKHFREVFHALSAAIREQARET